MDKKIAYIIANFGGPRHLKEIRPFLEELLTDRDVIRTRMPKPIHNYLFKRIAKKRSKKIQSDYESIGGKSPIYEDTEEIALKLRKELDAPVLTFHRYLPSTHEDFLQLVKQTDADEWIIFPLFPQFSYATTGSIARFFENHLPKETTLKMRWIKSYSGHPAFAKCYQKKIKELMTKHHLKEEKTVLLFSAHGLPQTFIEEGDLYLDECERSYRKILNAFPLAMGKLSFQSKFGPGEWLRPSTYDVCTDFENSSEERETVIFIPLSFTSDHLEILFEVERLYLPIIEEKGIKAIRCDALNQDEKWVEGIVEIIKESDRTNTKMLIRT